MTFLTNAFFVLAALFMLGVMVLVHECGHFFAARLTGIPVKEFGIGLGPKIAKWKSKKHDTDFLLRLIPAGGYCMFYGEDDADGKHVDDARSIGRHPVWKRALTIFMGPVMNFLLAFLVAVCFYFAAGVQTYGYAVIAEVSPGGAAEAAGVRVGDIVKSVNGLDAAGLSEDGGEIRVRELIGAYQQSDAPMTVTLARGDETISLQIAPRYDEGEGRMMIGVNLQSPVVYAPCTLPEAVGAGARYCVAAGGAVLKGLRQMFFSGEGIQNASGPVGIINMITEETRENGWLAYLSLLILISVNLGLFNLLPVPGLDGSRLIFLLIEAVRRKPVPQKIEAYVHMAGYLALIALVVVLTYKDILRIFS